MSKFGLEPHDSDGELRYSRRKLMPSQAQILRVCPSEDDLGTRVHECRIQVAVWVRLLDLCGEPHVLGVDDL